jgi:hypothetical protein
MQFNIDTFTQEHTEFQAISQAILRNGLIVGCLTPFKWCQGLFNTVLVVHKLAVFCKWGWDYIDPPYFCKFSLWLNLCGQHITGIRHACEDRNCHLCLKVEFCLRTLNIWEKRTVSTFVSVCGGFAIVNVISLTCYATVC